MTTDSFDIEDQGTGEYLVHADTVEGKAEITFALTDVEAVSGGKLADDMETARGTMRYLLRHQDAADLPERLLIEDILAAYEDAIDSIKDLRG